MTWVAVAIAGSAIVGGAISSDASRSASRQNALAAQNASDVSMAQYNQTRNDLAPWRDIGGQALNRLNDASNNFDSRAYLAANPAVAGVMDPYQHYLQYGKAEGRLATPFTGFQTSPNYEFTRSEGMRGIQQTAAAKGGLGSGNALKALSEFNSNLAAGQYNNWWNQQAGLAGIGQSATNATAQLGAQNTGQVGNALMQAGDARASGIMGAANGWSNSLNSGLNNYLLMRGGYFGNFGGGSGGGSGKVVGAITANNSPFYSKW